MNQKDLEELLLTDEEVELLYSQLPLCSHPSTLAIYSIPYGAVLSWAQVIAKNQAEKIIPILEARYRQMVEGIFREAEKPCPHPEMWWDTRSCGLCWQALKLKEIGE